MLLLQWEFSIAATTSVPTKYRPITIWWQGFWYIMQMEQPFLFSHDWHTWKVSIIAYPLKYCAQRTDISSLVGYRTWSAPITIVPGCLSRQTPCSSQDSSGLSNCAADRTQHAPVKPLYAKVSLPPRPTTWCTLFLRVKEPACIFNWNCHDCTYKFYLGFFSSQRIRLT